MTIEGAEGAYPGANGRIAFETNRDGNLEIYAMNPDGSGQTNLTNDSSEDTDPVWSPDGTRVAFVKASEGHRNIYVMNADGSGQTNLTPGPETSGQANGGVAPTWSPDGTRIAYAHGGGDIWVMNASDGSTKINLTRTPTSGESQPAWSPDGARIAYIRNADIWVMNADGANQTRLTNSTGALQDEKAPDWSPDGTRIVYGKGSSVWVMNADGTGQTQLAANSVLPAWSPNGTRIVFSSSSFGAPNGPDIFVMNTDGTGITRLPTAVPAIDNDPNWQPTGTPPPSSTTTALPSTTSTTIVPSTTTTLPATTTSMAPTTTTGPTTTTTTLGASADLSVSKVDSPDPVVPGSDLTYTITVSNAGPGEAASVSLVDTLPADTRLVSLGSSAGWSCTLPPVGPGGTFSCLRPSIRAGQDTGTIRVQVRVDPSVLAGTVLNNTATVSSASVDPNLDNNSSTATTTVQVSADLSVTKVGSSDPVVAGSTLTYTIAVANAGPGEAASVSWSDTLPAGTTFVSLSGGVWSCGMPPVGSNGTVSCRWPGSTFPVTTGFNRHQSVWTLTVAVRPSVPVGTVLANTATVSSASVDPNPENNSSTATTTVSGPTSTTATMLPPTTSTSTTSTSLPSTTSTSTTSTTVAPTTTTTTTTPPTTTTTSTSTTTTTMRPSGVCDQLRQRQAAFNAQIDATAQRIQQSPMSDSDRARVLAELEAARARGDAATDQAMIVSGCDSVTARKAQAPANTRAQNSDVAVSAHVEHRVDAGETLGVIASRYYGDGSRFARVFDANRDKLSDPNLIYPGQVLRVPIAVA